jgi:hypothetical protein
VLLPLPSPAFFQREEDLAQAVRSVHRHYSPNAAARDRLRSP